jgi:hypothetical protein
MIFNKRQKKIESFKDTPIMKGAYITNVNKNTI